MSSLYQRERERESTTTAWVVGCRVLFPGLDSILKFVAKRGLARPFSCPYVIPTLQDPPLFGVEIKKKRGVAPRPLNLDASVIVTNFCIFQFV